MDKETQRIKEDALNIVWFMRGGVSYSEVINMSQAERQMVADIIKERIEAANKQRK